MTLSQRLKQIRLEKSLTVEQLALLIGIPGRTISSYERGEHVPPSSYLALLNENLHVNINYLLSGKGTMFLSFNKSLRYEQLIRDEYNFSERDIQLIKAIIDFLKNREG
jgi:transcriptional regulator with XRE-family HTH domain